MDAVYIYNIAERVGSDGVGAARSPYMATSAGKPMADDILGRLSLQDLLRLKTVLGRLPPDTPQRFVHVSSLLFSHYGVRFTVNELKAVYENLWLCYGERAELDRQVRDTMDEHDYGHHSVVAIPSINRCMTCKGELVVVDKASKAFFYRLSGDAVDRGSAYYKICSDARCAGCAVKYWTSFFVTACGEKRVYTPEEDSFEGYDTSEWFQHSKETFFETTLLKDMEHNMLFSHMGFLPRCRIFNATHELLRTFIPEHNSAKKKRRSSGDSVFPTPPPPPPPPLPINISKRAFGATDPPSASISNKRHKRTHRYQLERRIFQRGFFGRRICVFVHNVAPWLRSEIALGDAELERSMLQVIKRDELSCLWSPHHPPASTSCIDC